MTTSYSTQRVTSDGTLGTLALSIDYFDRSEISVYLDDVLSTAWYWTTPTSKTIQFTDAPLALGVQVLVRRTTDISAVRHYFTGGAQFTYQTLDEDFKQILHIAQEAVEGAAVGDLYNNLNMHSYRILNLANPVEPQDAVPYSAYLADKLSIEVSEDAASASAAAALVSENKANAWANTPYGTAVEPGLYRAKHWSQVAQTAVTGVQSWNGRVGNVLPASGDYTAAEVEYGAGTVQDKLDIQVDKTSSTGAAKLPSGIGAERPGSPTAGMLRHNSELNRF